jgi:hypothetical protein
MGFVPIPHRGAVQVVKPLRDVVLVYCQNGIVALVRSNEDGARFRVQKAFKQGVGGRGWVAGDDRSHVFMDTAGIFWRIGADLSITKLGYQEYGQAFLEEEEPLVLSHDPEDDDVYASNGVRCLVISPGGASLSRECPHSLYRLDGTLTGPHVDLEPGEGDPYVEIVTLPFNMASADLKTVRGTELIFAGLENVMVSLLYRYSENDEWQETDAVPTNSFGVAFHSITATQFKKRITADIVQSGTPKLDAVVATFTKSGKRFHRGIYSGAGGV